MKEPGGVIKPDERGKHTPITKTPDAVVENVVEHTASFPAYESHYTCEKTQKKISEPRSKFRKNVCLHIYIIYILYTYLEY